MNYVTIVEEILDVYNINATEFAQRIDVQRSSISHILSGRNRPSVDMLIKIKDAFPELTWDFLMMGKKPMTENERAQIETMESKRQEDKNLNKFKNTTLSPTTPVLDDNPIKSNMKEKTKQLIKIVWFYNDNTFDVFEN